MTQTSGCEVIAASSKSYLYYNLRSLIKLTSMMSHFCPQNWKYLFDYHQNTEGAQTKGIVNDQSEGR